MNQISGNDFATIVAADLRALEHGLDATLALSTQTLNTMASGRAGAGLAAAVGQRGAEALSESIQNLIAARGAVVKAHNYLEREARAVGLEWTLGGPLESKPDEPIRTRPSIQPADEAV